MLTSPPSSATAGAPPTPLPAWFFAAPLLVALVAYAGSLRGGYVFDDEPLFAAGTTMAAGDWWSTAFGAKHTALANRPFACLSLVLDPAIGGSAAVGHRVVNLGLHALAAMLLLAVVRRTLLAPNLRATTGATANAAALAVATLWACHPLAVDAVAYPTQRSMLLMGLALLLALYAQLRAAAAPHHRRWLVVLVAALVLGMGSKEEFLAAPLLVLLFDRAFLAPDWRAVWSRRGRHAACCATWLVLAACVAAGPSNPTVGFDSYVAIGPFEWLATQSRAILHYLVNVVWPFDLRGIYAWPIVRDFGSAVLPLVAVTTLFVAGAWQWRRRPWLGWLAALFFLLLGPTSSFLPIVTEPVADRRAYLPMLALLAPLVCGAVRWFVPQRRASGTVLLALVATLFVVLTRERAASYRDQVTFWTAAQRQNDLDGTCTTTAMILGSYAKALAEQGRHAEATPLLERARGCEWFPDEVPLLLAECLWRAGDLAASERVLRDLLTRQPRHARALANLASVLMSRHEAERTAGTARRDDPRLEEVLRCSSAAMSRAPTLPLRTTTGLALLRMGRFEEAEKQLLEARRLGDASEALLRTLGELYRETDRPAEQVAALQPLLRHRRDDVDLRVQLAEAHHRLGDVDFAERLLGEALQIDPAHAAARRAFERLHPER